MYTRQKKGGAKIKMENIVQVGPIQGVSIKLKKPFVAGYRRNFELIFPHLCLIDVEWPKDESPDGIVIQEVRTKDPKMILAIQNFTALYISAVEGVLSKK